LESRAAVITGIEKELEIRSIPIPALPEGAVLIRVDAATLCGTDAHRWMGHIHSEEMPFIPGHETCGTIVDMQGDAFSLLDERLKIGDRIVSSYSHCGHCYYCRVARQTSLCRQNTPYGTWSPERLMGGCSEYHYFPPGASFVHVPPEVPPALAASSACALRTVLHGFEQLGAIASHESVLVLGAGPLGLYAAALARDKGAKSVYVIGAPALRVEVARAWGADEVLDFEALPDLKDRIEWVKERTGGRGADIAFNCASSPAFIEMIEMVRPGGRVVSIGHSGGPPLPLPTDFLFSQISVKTVVMAEARHFYQALDFLATRRDKFPFEMMLSNSYPLERTTDALRAMANYSEVKPVILVHASA
jgi:L-iditol 2-dehydrogenase